MSVGGWCWREAESWDRGDCRSVTLVLGPSFILDCSWACCVRDCIENTISSFNFTQKTGNSIQFLICIIKLKIENQFNFIISIVKLKIQKQQINNFLIWFNSKIGWYFWSKKILASKVPFNFHFKVEMEKDIFVYFNFDSKLKIEKW